MESVISDFDQQLHERKTSIWRSTLEKGEWDFEAVGKEKFTFSLKNGSTLEILGFDIKNKTEEDRIIRQMLFAEVGGKLVGFLSMVVEPPLKGYEIGMAGTNVEVLTKGLGIGSKLEQVRQYLLQIVANENYTLDNIIDDENERVINDELEKARKEFEESGDSVTFKKKVSELLMNRQLWLKLYGREGSGGYTWMDDDVYKTYKKGDPVPELNCEVSRNEANFLEEAKKL